MEYALIGLLVVWMGILSWYLFSERPPKEAAVDTHPLVIVNDDGTEARAEPWSPLRDELSYVRDRLRAQDARIKVLEGKESKGRSLLNVLGFPERRAYQLSPESIRQLKADPPPRPSPDDE